MMSTANYSFVLDFENEFDELQAISWMKENWTYSIYFDFIYLMVIFILKKIMQDRPPNKMKVLAVIWNIFLAIFSMVGTARTMPELAHSISFHGIHHSICDQSFLLSDKVTRVWAFVFVLSKVLELVDTVFVITRKHPLIFLHWYHHIVALTYSWFSYKDSVSTGRWFYVMNFFVHSLMYSYYAIRCLNYRLPKQIPMLITSLQIVQMVIAFFVNIYAYVQLQKGIECGTPVSNIAISSVMYLSFFILFARFFHQSYSNKSKEVKSKRN